MNHAELSRDLAFALGYYPESVRFFGMPDNWTCEVYRVTNGIGPYWRVFDYQDIRVAMPLLKWLITKQEAGISGAASGEPFCIWFRVGKAMRRVAYDTLEEAIARAVIAVEVKP